MNKTITSLFAACLALAGSSSAMADTCSLSFEAEGGGFQIGIGYYQLTGTGTIDCMDVHGEPTGSRKVNVKMGGSPVAARVAIGYQHVMGMTGAFTLNDSIESIYGKYAMVSADFAVGLGVGGSYSIQSLSSGYTMSLGMTGNVGVGVQAGLSTFTISPVKS